MRPKRRQAAGRENFFWISSRAVRRSKTLFCGSAGSPEHLRKELLAEVPRQGADAGIALPEKDLNRPRRDVVFPGVALDVVRDGVVEAKVEPARGLVDLEPAAGSHREPFAFLLGAVGDEEPRQDAAVRRRLLDIDPDSGELGRKDAGLDLLGNGERRQTKPHRGEEVIATRHGLEHEDERHGETDESEEADGPVEADGIDARGPKRDDLRVGAHPAEGDEEAQEEGDGERQHDDVREGERRHAEHVGERRLALEDEVGEENEPADDHEARVGEEADERGAGDLADDVAVESGQYGHARS